MRAGGGRRLCALAAAAVVARTAHAHTRRAQGCSEKRNQILREVVHQELRTRWAAFGSPAELAGEDDAFALPDGISSPAEYASLLEAAIRAELEQPGATVETLADWPDAAWDRTVARTLTLCAHTLRVPTSTARCRRRRGR